MHIIATRFSLFPASNVFKGGSSGCKVVGVKASLLLSLNSFIRAKHPVAKQSFFYINQIIFVYKEKIIVLVFLCRPIGPSASALLETLHMLQYKLIKYLLELI